MKKFYLLAVASMLVASASATDALQIKSASAKRVKSNKVEFTTSVEKAKTYYATATMADRSAVRSARKKLNPPVKGEAFYKRPAGVFMTTLTSNGYLWNNPIFSCKPYSNVVFEADDLDNYIWDVQLYNSSAKAYQWQTVEGYKSISVSPIWGEQDSIPSLTNGVTEYHYGGADKTGLIKGWGWLTCEADSWEDMYDEKAGGPLFSPKYFGWDRGGEGYATISIGGAQDAEGGTSASWFGHNYSGWNAMGLYVEKPNEPYMLRQVLVDYSRLEVAGNEATIKVEVFKVADRNNPDNQYFDCVPGELIASGTYTFVKDEDPAEGCVGVPFVVEEGGLEYEITPTIDDEILVVVSGYDSDDFANFTMSVAFDGWDEGYGQHGYMMHKEGEEYTRCYGLDGFFVGLTWESTAPTIFLDVVNPFCIFNFNIEDGVRNFDKDGNCTTKFAAQGYPYDMNVISLFSYTPSEEMEFTLEDGSDLPEWLTIEAVDEVDEYGDLTGEIFLTVNCEANAGAPREAKVKCAIPGAYVVLSITQEGEDAPAPLKGDVDNNGVVDISDISILIDIVLGKDDAANYDGRADLDGNGVVDVTDVNATINIILGK